MHSGISGVFTQLSRAKTGKETQQRQGLHKIGTEEK
jgi:hypothetical protein